MTKKEITRQKQRTYKDAEIERECERDEDAHTDTERARCLVCERKKSAQCQRMTHLPNTTRKTTA
eukprot:SAG11_NODE_32748_length_281_cov_0.681319_1_plen_65_part_00